MHHDRVHSAGAILLRLPAPPALLRWHQRLNEHLAARDFTVSVEIHGVAPLPSWFGLLSFFEQRLYASRAVGAQDLLAPVGDAWVPKTALEKPRLCIDCTDRADLAGLPVLRPGVAAGRVELNLLADALDHRPPAVGWHVPGRGAVASGTAALTALHIHSQGVSEGLARMISMVDVAIAAALKANTGGSGAASSPAGVFAAGAGFASTFANRVVATINRRLRSEGQWNIGWRPAPADGGILATGMFDPTAYQWLPRDAGYYMADPFPLEHEGQRVLFVEQYPYATGRGIISMLPIGEDGPVGEPVPVIERPHHLSYPCIFAHSGQLWMLPESAGAGRLELFRCEKFPDRWVLHSVLFEGRTIADATVFEHDGRCWLAGAVADGGASDRDALALWHAPHPEGPWTPHPGNPVVVDVATARPAGGVRNIGGRLRRPAQDCTHGYGWGLAVLEIEELTPEIYRETRIAAFPPPAALGATAFHTLNVGAGIECIDAVL